MPYVILPKVVSVVDQPESSTVTPVSLTVQDGSSAVNRIPGPKGDRGPQGPRGANGANGSPKNFKARNSTLPQQDTVEVLGAETTDQSGNGRTRIDLHRHDPKEYGCVGDGTTDDQANLAATDTAAAAAGESLYLSAGIYRLGTNTTFEAEHDLSGTGVFRAAAGVTLTHNGKLHGNKMRQWWDASASGATIRIHPTRIDYVTPQMFGARGDYQGVQDATSLTSPAVSTTTLEVASSAGLVEGSACVIKDAGTGTETVTLVESVVDATHVRVTDAITADSGSYVCDYADTLAFLRMIDTVVSANIGGTALGGSCHLAVYIPQGRYRIMKQLRWDRLRGSHISGSGEWATILYWDGSLSTPPLNVVSATNATPIEIETDAPHNLSNGDIATVQNIVGSTHTSKYHAGNRRGIVTVVDGTHFQINSSTGNDTYASGGQVWTAQHGTDAMMLFYNCRNSIVEGFHVRVDSTETNPPFILMEQRGDFSDPLLTGFVPTEMRFQDIWLVRGSIGLAVTYAAGSANNNNDQHRAINIQAENQSLAGFSVGIGPGGSAGSNMKDIEFHKCRSIGLSAGGTRYGLMIWGGSGSWDGGFMRDHHTSTTTLTSPAAGDTVLQVADSSGLHAGLALAIQESTGNRWVYDGDSEQFSTTIISVDSSTQVTVADALTAASGSTVFDSYGDNYADFALASTTQSVDDWTIRCRYFEKSAHVFIDMFDSGANGSIPAPILFDNCTVTNGLPGTDLFTAILRRSNSRIIGGTYGNLAAPPARFYCSAPGTHVAHYEIKSLKLFGSPPLGGGRNGTNVEHLVKSGLAEVDDRDHIFGDGTSNPTLKENRPARPVKATTTDDLRAIISPIRFGGDIVALVSRKGRAMAWDPSTGLGVWDDDQTQIRPTDTLSSANGMWYMAGERVYASDLDHLRLLNSGRWSFADVGWGADPYDTLVGPYAWDPYSTAPHDGLFYVAPAINEVVRAKSESNLLGTGWAFVNASSPDGVTLIDTVDGSSVAHSVSYTLTNLNISGTVDTEFVVDLLAVGGSPIHRVQIASPGIWSRIVNVDTGTDTGSVNSIGALATITALSSGGYRYRFRCKPTSNLLTIYLGSNTGNGTNQYQGDGTGAVKVLHVGVFQNQTAAGRHRRLSVTGTVQAPLGDNTSDILISDGANVVDPRTVKTANRTNSVKIGTAAAQDQLTIYVRPSPYTRTLNPTSGTGWTSTVGRAARVTFWTDGTNTYLGTVEQS